MALSPQTVNGFVFFLTLAVTFALPVQSQTTVAVTSEAQSTSRPVILLTVDSHTEQGTYPTLDGWISRLQARYTNLGDVITRGLPGYNTKWFLKYVMPTLEQEITSGAYTTPSLITVWLGTNDAALVNGSSLEMHVPIEEYKENLNQIVPTPAHIDDDARTKYAAERTDTKRGLVDRSDAATGNYARACVEVANELKVSVLDLYEHFKAMPVETQKKLLSDGIHFTAAGNKVVDSQFQSKITSDFPALTDTLDTWQFPKASKYVAEDPWTAGNAPSSRS
ncbi:SGNH hydrolase-type esterase domain [Phytophthora cactorum]|nr:SGNH hydrolase-type esterase domain [Phytophthora cactorum]